MSRLLCFFGRHLWVPAHDNEHGFYKHCSACTATTRSMRVALSADVDREIARHQVPA